MHLFADRVTNSPGFANEQCFNAYSSCIYVHSSCIERPFGKCITKTFCSIILVTNFDVDISIYILQLLFSSQMRFDLQIATTLFNGSCVPLSEGSVVLSYRIGSSRQWKTIQEYTSHSKYY